jgi:cytochrome c
MNSFELNKILGALLFACLCLLSLNIAAGAIFSSPKLEKPGYEIAVQEKPAAGEKAAPAKEVPIAQLLASADVKKGEVAAKKCQACHTFEKGGPNRVGPNLYGIVGDHRGEGRGGFNFSTAMKAKGGTWTFEDLNAFIKSPKAFIPGTAMGFAGISKDSERADVIAYLNTLSDSPKPLPKAADAGAAPKAADAGKPADVGQPAAPAAGAPAAGAATPAAAAKPAVAPKAQ